MIDEDTAIINLSMASSSSAGGPPQEFNVGDLVQGYVHERDVSVILYKDPVGLKSPPWSLLHGVIERKMIIDDEQVYRVKTTSLLGVPNEMFLLAKGIHLFPRLPQSAETFEIHRIIGSRLHLHNQPIDCPSPCFAEKDFLVKGKENNCDTFTWVNDVDLPRSSKKCFEDREIYRTSLFYQVKYFFKGVTQKEDYRLPKEVVRAAYNCLITYTEHDCEKFYLCNTPLKQCREEWDFILQFEDREIRMIASVAPYEEYLFLCTLKSSFDLAKFPWYPRNVSLAGETSIEDSVPSGSPGICKICEKTYEFSDKEVQCVGCVDIVHKSACSIQVLHQQNAFVCISCESLRCSSCFQIFAGGPVRCFGCLRYICADSCSRLCEPLGEHLSIRCFSCASRPLPTDENMRCAACFQITAGRPVRCSGCRRYFCVESCSRICAPLGELHSIRCFSCAPCPLPNDENSHPRKRMRVDSPEIAAGIEPVDDEFKI